ncbi:hypothetical protein TraAM80_04831 [Trypanosoma rangeli]|uniref:Uncharacterized protein n=1 Tax=Trypanosoma rangeli TaxID=5698 RepID=A0A422NHN1_TRYRA|nr:uncharacterized protein TraAM80_04831 [Trypanosoma rangeli]RNF04993.1 hypothetical protein TraAM80_04831 [Trypanosoma rangeli]|eukprot:RNF04993.1 hypothetical protein TraAM80_04831 [Trypanosoma rangeli]
MRRESIPTLRMPPRNTKCPAGKSERHYTTLGKSEKCSRSGSLYVFDLPAFPQMRAAPGRSGVVETMSGILLVDDDEPQHGRTPSGHGVNSSRTGPIVPPEDVGKEDEEYKDSGDLSSSLSSAYVRHRRYENPFTAYQPVSDPYDRHREMERQQRFMNDSKQLGRPFIPCGGRALEKPTRYMLGDCVASIYRTVVRDWPETAPMVISTAEDLIVVYMKRDRVRNTHTLLRYMNDSLKRNEAVRMFDLRKVPEGWDVITDDGHMMYTFKPPWVRQRRFLPDQVVAHKAH